MSKVFERLGHEIIDGFVIHNDISATIERAEELAGCTLDRRRNYTIINSEVCLLSEHTQECSGCFEAGEYMGFAQNYDYDDKAGCYVGSGCSECGYTGKRRVGYWIPVSHMFEKKELDG